MTLRVSGKNLDIGEALRQHVLEKVEATVARYFNGSVGGHVVVTREGSGFRSDCTLRLSSGISLHAEGRAHEPYLCFEQAADKIERRLRRYKTRLKGHSLAATASERGKVANYLIEQPGEEDEEPAGGFNPVVVAEGTEELKSLSVASAVAELDLTGVPVVVFQHAGSGRVNVVYRRRDGAIGWLDPQAPRISPRAD
ncbi:MAG TPA: ribosome-associated translation inhibitor RaiA [Roseiarcus sp.]|jgi:ribosomal subunit interface protein|nr:ribosome-associated translation inhibitor RaiA [Roseiarcus sp.]